MTDETNKQRQQEEQARKRSLRSQYPKDMGFFPFSTKFVSEDEPLKAPWLPEYHRQRSLLDFQERSTPAELRKVLTDLGADASEQIDRFRGTLLGAALGDALGMPLAELPRGAHRVTELESGGLYQLDKGSWTDATSMSSCVAYSLETSQGFDPGHMLTCLSYWYRFGAYSVVAARCLGIGPSVKRALDAYLQTGDPHAPPPGSPSAGNASLTRIAPVVLFYFDNFEQCVEYAERSSRLTHSAPEAVDSCRYFAALLFGALRGEDKAKLMAPYYSPIGDYWARKPLCSAVDAIAAGSYKSKTRSQIESTSYAVHTLESALWAFHNNEGFSAGALEAVNLAGDADATGAVFGALAGAYYGEMQLPYAWLRWLSYVQGFYHFAQELLALSAVAREPAST